MINLHRGVISLAQLAPVERTVNQTPAIRRMVSRFIAGDNLADALRVATALQQDGIDSALDLLGENVSHEDEARRAADGYIDVIAGAHAAGLRSVYASVKLTALGLDISKDLATANLVRILESSSEAFVRVDMEASAYTEATVEIVTGLHRHYPNLGIVLQSYLYRTDADIEEMIERRIPVRLVKGAYAEPSTVAYPKKSDVDNAYRRQLARLLDAKHPTAVASHDPEMIYEAKRLMREKKVDNDLVEFQMLLGIRSDLTEILKEEGYRVRTYIPFGSHWYPYFVRRLAERPANLFFILKNLR